MDTYPIDFSSRHGSVCTALFVLLNTLLFGGCSGGPTLLHHKTALINGVPDTVHTSVGQVLLGSGGGCTATLVGKKTVLTAGHCVVGDETYTFLLRDKRNSDKRYAVQSKQIHPNLNYRGYEGNDIALLVLAESVDLADVVPAKLSAVPPKLGGEVTLVGISNVGTDQLQVGPYAAVGQIRSISLTRFLVEDTKAQKPHICPGDSGGPSFAVEPVTMENDKGVIVGVHSTEDGFCGKQSHDMRIDAYKPWLDQHSPEPLTWVTASSTADAHTPVGMRCDQSTECAMDFCYEVPALGYGYCTQPCNPAATSASCPAKMACVKDTAALTYICKYNNPDDIVSGAGCSLGSAMPLQHSGGFILGIIVSLATGLLFRKIRNRVGHA